MPIAAVAALGCLLTACGPTAPDPTTSGPVPKTTVPTTVPAPTTSTTSTTAPSSSAAAPVSYTWNRSSATALDLGGGATSTLSAVLAPPQAGADWTLAGTRSTSAGATDATVWTSPDATTWTATALRGGTGGQARGAVTWGNRTVVVGSLGRGSSQRAAVWISPNPGASFAAVPDATALDVPANAPPDLTAGSAEPRGDSGSLTTTAGPGAVMDTVTSGALGLFASGTIDGHLAMWYSTNGTTWSRLAKAEGVITSSPGATVRQILETPAGVFAAGSIRKGSSTDAALWTSGDGINWRQLVSPSSFAGPGDQVLTGISTFGPNLVVAGGIRLSTSWIPASWISPSSFTWGPPSESFPEPTGMRSDLVGAAVAAVAVSPSGTTLAAVGGSPSQQRLWTSTDGSNWTPVALPPAAADDADWTAGAVATTGATTVVVDPAPGQPRLLVDSATGWQEVSADPAVFGVPQTTATPTHLVNDGRRLVMTVNIDQPGETLGGDQDSTVVLTSPDGKRWTVASTGNTFLGQAVTDLSVTPTGLLAAGGPAASTATVTAAAAAGGPGPGLTVWTSTNAADWTAAALGPAEAVTTAAPVGANDPVEIPAGAVTSLGHTLYAASASGSDPAVGWKADRTTAWASTGTLDLAPPAETETVAAACSMERAAVVVGDVGSGAGGSRGMAWPVAGAPAAAAAGSPVTSSAGGATGGNAAGGSDSSDVASQPGVSPPPPADSGERLLGCASIDAGALEAWGASAGSTGTPEGALWSSSDGARWNRQAAGEFGAGAGTAAITDLAMNGNTWLAVTGASTEPWTEDALSALGLWESPNAGKTWQQLTTTGATWTPSFGVSARQVAYFGIDAVVAGEVDGHLTVWVGTPTP